MKSWYVVIIAFCWLTVLISVAKAQAVTAPLLHTYPRDGAGSHPATQLLKDNKGFVWTGTQAGLTRFDGSTFLNISLRDSASEPKSESYVSALVEDSINQLLWAATTAGDICAIDINTLAIVKRIKPLPHRSPLPVVPRTLAIRNNILWAGSAEGISAYSLAQPNIIKQVSLAAHQPLASLQNVSCLYFDSNGYLWAGCNEKGIYLFDASLQLRTFSSADSINLFGSPGPLRFWKITENSEGTIGMATSWGIRLFSQGRPITKAQITEQNLPFFLPGSSSCSFANADRLMACVNGSVYSYSLSSCEIKDYRQASPEQQSWLTSARQVHCDANNNVWLGTQKGLARFSLVPPPFSRCCSLPAQGNVANPLHSLLPVGDSLVYAGAGSGLFYTNINTGATGITAATETNSLLFSDSHHNIIVSNESGVFALRDKELARISTIDPVLRPLRRDLLNCAIQYNDSLVCFSSLLYKGISVWNSRAHTLQRYRSGAAAGKTDGLGAINYMYKSRKGELFVVTESSLFSLDPVSGRSVRYFMKNGAAGQYATHLMDMCETDDSYFIATNGGGIIQSDKQLNRKRQITTSTGLCDDHVYRLFTYHDSLLIATTRAGLAVVNLATGAIRNYFEADGLQTDAFAPLCGYQRDNLIYAGGTDGFTIINAAQFTTNKMAPQLFVTGVEILTTDKPLGATDMRLTHLEIPNNWLQAKITFAGINAANPANVRYRYRIQELHEDWIFLDQQSFVMLTGLPPGAYTLAIAAANEDGVWSAPKKLLLHVAPRWYQTLWWQAGWPLVVLVLLIVFHRMCISALQRRLRQHTIIYRSAGRHR